ncbi:IS3 family transposase [Streptomyces sp. NPDC058430]|uniref:IS3 family transposase n=1 Tax=Streptomyces sp. NPDC058430 TaxID=3346495 RepID=UPI003654CF19
MWASPAHFYCGRRTAGDGAARQVVYARLAPWIRAVRHESGGTYSVPRITAELRDAGERVNHKRIARVMRDAGPAGVRLRRRHRGARGRRFQAGVLPRLYRSWRMRADCQQQEGARSSFSVTQSCSLTLLANRPVY